MVSGDLGGLANTEEIGAPEKAGQGDEHGARWVKTFFFGEQRTERQADKKRGEQEIKPTQRVAADVGDRMPQRAISSVNAPSTTKLFIMMTTGMRVRKASLRMSKDLNQVEDLNIRDQQSQSAIAP